VDARETLFFGGQNAAELLAQHADLAGDRADDAVLVLTDGSGYALTATAGEIAPPRAPVWLVHLGGVLPLGYDDATLEAVLASGGGVAGSVEEALIRIAAGQGAGGADWVDGYAWSMDDAASVDGTADGRANAAADNMPQPHRASPAEAAFAPFAARYHVLAETRRQREQLGAVETLDGIHALAVDAEIVTPYSSMIVLVTEDQQRLLDRLEKQSDRFDRELEAIGDTEGERAPVVTGVPEPETWLLLAMAAALLAAGARQRRLEAGRPAA
jgi:putative PEP-CTERM system integral membrane protein